MPERKGLNKITGGIIGAAIEVHRVLGPGLLEAAYDACLAYELTQRRFKIEQQKPLPVAYGQVKLDCADRLDLLVEDSVIVEIKAIDRLLPIRQAQLLSCLKLSNCELGLLINFNVKLLKQGIQRLINNTTESQRSPRSLR